MGGFYPGAHAVRTLCHNGLLQTEQGVLKGRLTWQVGENARDGDMDVNPVREKKLTNVRSAGNDEKVRAPAKISKPFTQLNADVVRSAGDDDEKVGGPCPGPRPGPRPGPTPIGVAELHQMPGMQQAATIQHSEHCKLTRQSVRAL